MNSSEVSSASFSIVALSATSESKLRGQAATLAARRDRRDGERLDDACFSISAASSEHAHRVACIGETWGEMCNSLRRFSEGMPTPNVVSGSVNGHPKVAFVFTGQGGQYAQMAMGLYHRYPSFRARIDGFSKLLEGKLERPLTSLLFESNAAAALRMTQNTQPALFAVEYALAELWRSVGVEPAAVMGHSVGEYTAACVAGVLEPEEALLLVAERGRIIASLPQGGGMVALGCSEERAVTLLERSDAQISIAAVNGPRNTVVAGRQEALAQLLEFARDEGLAATPLNVSHAFHSALMEPALAPFEQFASRIKFRAPRIPLVSNLSGACEDAAPTAERWARHIRAPVRFSDGVKALVNMGCDPLLEVGPGTTLTSMGERVEPDRQWLCSLRRSGNDVRALLEATANLYVRGVNIDWQVFSTVSNEPLASARVTQARVEVSDRASKEPIAVVGMHNRAPRAADLAALWRNLREGVDAVGELPEHRFSRTAIFSEDRADLDRSYARWGAVLDDIHSFDPSFFAMSVAEAAALHPAQRLFLEVAQETLDHAGYGCSGEARRSTGVFVGGRQPGEALRYLETVRRCAPRTISTQVERMAMLARQPNFLATWVSDRMDLSGPAMVIDAACSSSLVALHLACQALRRNECEMALAGGVDLILDQELFVLLGRVRALSPTGRCRTFDSGADGYVMGEGAGAVLLKPLSKAQADGDTIHGLVLDSFVNNDGRTMGITTPNVNAQVELLERLYGPERIDPRTVSYIEAHGTGTMIGDPIEVRALSKVFQRSGGARGWCGLGSVKSNIGHLHTAAGILGTIKILLAMQHRTLPKTLHCESPNPRLELERSPFYPLRRTEPWNLDQQHGPRRRAGISGFAMGGTNAHVVLEEAPQREEPATVSGAQLLTLSAGSPAALNQLIERYETYLAQTRASLVDIAGTSQRGRTHQAHRIAILADTKEGWVRGLKAARVGEAVEGLFVASGTLMRKAELDDAARALLSAEGTEDPNTCWAKAAQLYCDGAQLDWANLQPSSPFQRVPLPVTAFARRPCDLEAELGGASRQHPLVDEARLLADGAIEFEKRFSPDEPFLAEHQLYGRPVLPGVCHLELLRAAASLASARKVSGFEQVEWISPLVVADGRTAVVRGRIEPDGRFEVSSEGPHVRGRILFDADLTLPETGAQALIAARAHEGASVEADAIFSSLRALGYYHGPIYQNLAASTTVHEREYLARMNRTERPDSYEGKLVLDPGLMDSATLAALGESTLAQLMQQGDLFIPLCVERVIILGAIPARSVVHAQLHTWSTEVGRVTLSICAPDGAPKVILQDLAFKRVPPVLLTDREAPAPSLAGLYHGRWREVPAVPMNAEVPRPEGVWLVIGPAAHRSVFQRRLGERRLLWMERATEEALWEAVAQASMVLFAQAVGPALPDESPGALSRSLLRVLQAAAQAPQRPPVVVLTQGAVQGQAEETPLPARAALLGMVRSAALELGRASVRAIDVDPLEQEPERLLQPVLAELSNPAPATIACWRRGKRNLRILEPVEQARPIAPLARGASCVVTGGLGGLGLAVARGLFASCGARLTLIGRSGLSTPERAEAVAALERDGAQVLVCAADVSDEAALAGALAQSRARFGPIDAIYHAAGVAQDGLLTSKSPDELDAVFAPKVAGAIHLDRLSREDPIARFIIFSSLSGVLGNLGQADYAAANAFLDAWAIQRTARGAPGETRAIAWSAWKEAGMAFDREVLTQLEAQGLQPLSTERGLTLLQAAIAQPQPSVVAVDFDPFRIDLRAPDALLEPIRRAPEPSMKARARENTVATEALDAEEVVRWLAQILKVEPEALQEDPQFLELGIDSAALVQSASAVEEAADIRLYPTAFFEHPTPKTLAAHLMSEHPEAIRAAVRVETPAPKHGAQNGAQNGVQNGAHRFAMPAPRRAPPAQVGAEPIAIVGAAGLYPQAEDLVAFWERLEAGEGAVRPMPSRRAVLFGEAEDASNRGTFLADVERFDASRFGVSSAEADALDPQQRLFLEVAQRTLEDATDDVSQLRGAQIGVFVGYSHDHYAQVRRQAEEEPAQGISLETTLANRLSFLMDWRGPSLVVNTLCSSSLVAIHHAVKALQGGECTAALAGGVHAALSPAYFRTMRTMGALSKRGESSPFDAQADGYVPGEGVGAVMLKTLSRAEADGDRILGVIRASAVSQAGRGGRFDAPNPSAQRSVISDALARAGLTAEQIDYVEAHATGTLVGDAIELKALVEALEGERKSPCMVGSLKPLFGHQESAAGIAGVHKLLGCFDRERLPGTANIQAQSPLLELGDGTLQLVRTTQPWPAKEGRVRRAGISGFGMFGVYAHLILEEPPQTLKRSLRAARPFEGNPHWLLPGHSTLEPPELVTSSAPKVIEPHTDTVPQVLAALIAELPGGADPGLSFLERGLDSVGLTSLAERLSARFGVPLSPLSLFEHPTPQALATHLSQVPGRAPQAQPETAAPSQEREPAERNAFNILLSLAQKIERRLATLEDQLDHPNPPAAPARAREPMERR